MPLKELGPGLFEIGKVRLNKTRRSVSIPVTINMTQGNVEYLVVTALGKTHESVLRTTASPYDMHVAMLLLGAKGRGTNEFPEQKLIVPPGDAATVEVSWKSGENEERVRAEALIFDRAANSAMQKVNWIYNGSQITAEGFAAQQTGSIVSLIDDPEALINNPLPSRADDDNWRVNTNMVSAIKQPAELVISLHANKVRN